MSANYEELIGRKEQKDPRFWLYQTLGVATDRDDDNIPVVGNVASTLTTVPVHTFPPTCTNIEVDELSYPGRHLFICNWSSPKTRTEALP